MCWSGEASAAWATVGFGTASYVALHFIPPKIKGKIAFWIGNATRMPCRNIAAVFPENPEAS